MPSLNILCPWMPASLICPPNCCERLNLTPKCKCGRTLRSFLGVLASTVVFESIFTGNNSNAQFNIQNLCCCCFCNSSNFPLPSWFLRESTYKMSNYCCYRIAGVSNASQELHFLLLLLSRPPQSPPYVKN